jgi:phosphate transport system permease protein
VTPVPSAARPPRRDLLGDSLSALCGGALAVNLLLVAGLVVLIAVNGLGFFWQKDLALVTLEDGTRLLGEIHAREEIPGGEDAAGARRPFRIKLKTGNRDLTGADFRWVDEREIRSIGYPPEALVLERAAWGNFHGWLVELRRGDDVLAPDPEAAWRELGPLLARMLRLAREVRALEKGPIGDVNHALDLLRLEERRIAIAALPEAEREERRAALARGRAEREAEYRALSERLFGLREELRAETAIVSAADGARRAVPAGDIVRALRPNSMSAASKARLYASRVWEFVSGEPRESNTEGGIFPAIFGTVMMVFIMSFAVAPLGVLAALYLREYARQGLLVRVVRIAVNNLAGVPSIVFGVFGLGFFVYLVGGTIDRIFYPEALPAPTFGTGGILWASLTLALLTVPLVIVATEEGLAAVPRVVREGSLALGATKLETTWRVVLPAAAPGILTGLILAMARAAGEVAPLMLVGMVKLAPALPIDHHFPFVHLERKFMHLGFHIYDVGFQSPNVDATKPLVFATSLLLIVIVTAMNLGAIGLRNHLRRKYASSAV